MRTHLISSIPLFLGDVWISEIPVICRYLGQEVFNMVPKSIADRLHGEQITQNCHKCFVDGMTI